jgi:hypothetical protein
VLCACGGAGCGSDELSKVKEEVARLKTSNKALLDQVAAAGSGGGSGIEVLKDELDTANQLREHLDKV